MQENEFVFKVPSTKQRRPNLYCTETVDDLDKIWNSPLLSIDESVRKSAQFARKYKSETVHNHARRLLFKLDDGVTESNSVQYLQEVLDADGSSIDTTPAVLDYEVSLADETFLSTGSDGECWFHTPRDKYTMGLLDELGRSGSHSIEQADSFESSPQQLVSSNPSAEDSSSAHSESFRIENEQCSLQTTPAKNFVGHDVYPSSPDVLIVRDESMANADSDSSGSNSDWECPTPPAPRSPGDHIVPNFAELNSSVLPANFLLDSVDNVSSMPQVENLGVIGDREIGWDRISVSSDLHHNFPNSTFDQVVPEFFF